MANIKVYLNEGEDHFFGFHNDFADAPALRLALAFTLPDEQPHATLERVYRQLNIGGDLEPAESWTVLYRRNGNRSLSVGDVVIIGETAWAVSSFGWVRITTDDLLDAIRPLPKVSV